MSKRNTGACVRCGRPDPSPISIDSWVCDGCRTGDELRQQAELLTAAAQWHRREASRHLDEADRLDEEVKAWLGREIPTWPI